MTTQISLWMPRQKAYVFQATSCSSEWTRNCTSWGLSSGITHYSHSALPVRYSECQRALVSKTWRNQSLVELAKGYWSTGNKIAYKWRCCLFDYCYSIDNFHVQSGSIATFTGVDLQSDLGDLSGCRYAEKFCAVRDSLVMWSAHQTHSFCSYARRGAYEARIAENCYILVEALQMAFMLTSLTANKSRVAFHQLHS